VGPGGAFSRALVCIVGLGVTWLATVPPGVSSCDARFGRAAALELVGDDAMIHHVMLDVGEA
jgi:hypothetical protein